MTNQLQATKDALIGGAITAVTIAAGTIVGQCGEIPSIECLKQYAVGALIGGVIGAIRGEYLRRLTPPK